MQQSYFDTTNDLFLASLTRPVSRRTLLLTLAAGLGSTAVSLLASCVPPSAAPGATGGAAPQAASEQVTLQFWHYQTGSDETIWNNMINAFNDQHPSIHIEAILLSRPPDFVSKLSAAFASNQSPDFVFVNSLGEIDECCGDKAVDLNNKGLDLNDFKDRALDASRYGSVLVGLPMDVRPIAAIINKAHAEAAGLDLSQLPTDNDSLLQWAQAMTIRDNDGNITRSGFLLTEIGFQPNLVFGIMATQGGARFVDENLEPIDFNTQATQDAAQWIIDAFDALNISKRERLLSNQNLVEDFFKAQLGSMLWHGPWALRALKEQSPSWPGWDNLIVAKVPNVYGTGETLGPVSVLSVFTPSDQEVRQDAAIEAIKWLSDNSFEWVTQGPGIAPRKSVLDSREYQNAGPPCPPWVLREPFKDSLDSLYVENFAWHFYTDADSVAREMDSVWSGQTSINDGLNAVSSTTRIYMCCRRKWPCCKTR